MRPIELTVKGLHSFREKQTVDFSSLCKRGVFGIFGPTGSGKSSLLDAMTLALYGKVERAIKNTQGIMNQAEDTLSVSFIFELRPTKEKAFRYKIERELKRSGDYHVKTSVCRLLDLTTSPVVLADKTNEVNKRIETMLGLSIDDFTRAVVLPQGKFSEFLKLRGTERRQMLQRLFHLEKYGDDLIKKVRSQLQQAEHEKEKLKAEQMGLGDASKEALKKAKDHYDYWDDQLVHWIKKKTKMEEEWEQVKQIRAWQKEKEEANQHLKELENQKVEIEKMKDRLQESKEAEALRPFADTFLLTKEEERNWRIQKEEKGKEHQEMTTNEKEVAREWEAFSKEKEEKEKEWSELKQTITQIEELQKEISYYRKEKEKTARELQTGMKKEKDLKEQANKMKKDMDKYQEAVHSFQEKQGKMQVPTEVKHTLLRARQDKQHIQELDNQWSDLVKEEKEKQSEKQQVTKRIEQTEEAILSVTKGLETRFSQLMYWFNKTAEDKGWLEKELEKVKREIERETEKQNKRKWNEMAAHLSTHLTEGEPCPVCGSTSHPQVPTNWRFSEEEEKDVKDMRKQQEERINELQHFQLVMKQREWKLEQFSSFITEEVEIAAALSVENEDEGLHRDSQTEKEWVYKKRQWEKEDETVARLFTHIEEELKKHKQWMEEKRRYEYEVEITDKALKVCSEKRKVKENERYGAMTQWKKRYPDFSLDTVEQEYSAMEQKEIEGEHLRKRIEKGKTHIENLQMEYEELQKKQQDIAIQNAEVQSQNKQLSAFLEEKNERAEHLLKGQSLDRMRTLLEKQMSEWSLKERNLKTELESLGTQLQKVENELAVAVHSFNDAQNRHRRACVDWEKQIGNSMFRRPEKVTQSILSIEQKEAMESRLSNYEKEKDKWLTMEQELTYKLSGRVVEEKEWEEWKQSWNSMNTYLDEVREKRGAALETFHDVERKHTRYQSLEKDRKKWEEKAHHFKQLDEVFRGKGFVEFLAEEQLIQISRMASERLHALTRGRYAIEVDSTGGFIVRDDANGGIKRPVTTLSGGETFLTSLALALSLSSSIQLKGEYPLEFFFLDEGFGTLDQELLDTVISALEKLQTNDLAVGIISHVPDLQERLPRKIYVTPAEPGGAGSRVHLEVM